MKLDIQGKDLSRYLATADEVSHSAMERKSAAFQLCDEVDRFTREEVWGAEIDLAPIPATLALSSYYSFLGAVRIALSGQANATFPIIRQCIESACYAHNMASNPELQDVWLRRHSGNAQRKACKQAFGGSIRTVIESLHDKPDVLATLIKDLYEASIDFGAHPNSKSVLNHLTIEERQSEVEVSLVCLYGAEDFRLDQALLACAETGISTAFITALAANSHPLADPDLTKLAMLYERVRETADDISQPSA